MSTKRRFLSLATSLYMILTIFLGIIMISLVRNEVLSVQTLMIPSLFTLLIIVLLVLNRSQIFAEDLLLTIVLFLCAFGLIVLDRLKPALLFNQMLWVTLGVAVVLIANYLIKDSNSLGRYKYTFGLIGIVLLISPLLFGTNIGGAKSWIILGPLRFEPSEFAKLSLVVFLAGYLADNRELLMIVTKRIGILSIPHPRYLGPMLVFWLLAVLMLVVQRDLGAALLFFGTFMAMVYVASQKWSLVFWGTAFFICGALFSYLLFGHVRDRFMIWLNPWVDANGAGYQLVQSLFAFGSGGLLGTGFGIGHPEFIPEVHTDFVFAAIGEEFGLAGAVGLLLLYAIFIQRALKIALAARTDFTMLLATGLGTLFALQTFVIIGGITKIIPLTGVTLPFLSYGGSSMIANFMLLAILMIVARDHYATSN